MNDEMTPREHDDMRDLLMAGAERIRPAASRRAQVSAALAVAVVAGVIAVVATVTSNLGTDAEPAIDGPSPTRTATQGPTPSRTLPPVAEGCEPRDFPRASLPAAPPPGPGGRLSLEPDPCLTAHSLLGSATWLEDQGIDTWAIQGFQGVADIEPWIADLKDGSGRCILLRADDHNGWGEIACDAGLVPASVERVVGDLVLRFEIEDDAVAVSATAR